MQPTVRPPWSGWPSWTGEDGYRRRRVRLTLEDLADLRKIHNFADLRGLNFDWRQISRQEIVYVPKNLRHRFENSGSGGRATSGLTYPTSEGSWRPDRYPIDTGSWRIPDLQHIRLQALPPGDELVTTRRWEGSARAWAAGALVLAVIILIVRAVEKCLHRKFYKGRRRRQSEEWPTPNVLATSQRQGNEQDISIPRLEDSDAFPSEVNQDTVSNDLPPPYSECANTTDNTINDASKYIGLEEPPPPYSACYIAYSSPKDSIPSVHFYNRQRENFFLRSETGHSSNDTGTNEENIQPRPENPELIFENGRIIEMPNQRTEDIPDDVCIVNIDSGQRNVSSPRHISGTQVVPESHLEV